MCCGEGVVVSLLEEAGRRHHQAKKHKRLMGRGGNHGSGCTVDELGVFLATFNLCLLQVCPREPPPGSLLLCL